MDEEWERTMVPVRADTAAFARDVTAMRAELEAGLGRGADAAGRAIEFALIRAVRTGSLGFEDLKRAALSAMAEIAAAAIRTGLDSIGGGSGQGGGGLLTLAAQLVGALAGAPGRATGGPVAAGRPYLVGERGPELFVPTASGRVEAGGGGGREVRVSINVNAPSGEAPRALAQSSRQVARAVRRALTAVE